MEFRLKMHHDPVYAEVIAHGDAIARDFELITEELIEQENYIKGIGFLHDYRGVNTGELTVADVRGIAEMVASHRDLLGNGKWAILVERDLEYGMGRMWSVLVEEIVDLEIRIFRDESEARSWVEAS